MNKENMLNIYNKEGKQFLIGWKEGRMSFTYPNGKPVETFNIHEYHPISLDIIWDLEYALIYYGFDIVTALGIIYKLGYEFCLDDELERMRGFIKAVQKKKEHERRIEENMKSGIWRYGD